MGCNNSICFLAVGDSRRNRLNRGDIQRKSFDIRQRMPRVESDTEVTFVLRDSDVMGMVDAKALSKVCSNEDPNSDTANASGDASAIPSSID